VSGEPTLPPRWFIHTFWRVHRALHQLSGGRLLWTPDGKRGWGAMRLTTSGWHSGRARDVILGYLEDGPNLVVLAMNGWEEGDPSWWRNLQADPDGLALLPGGRLRPVRARAASGEERDRLWERWLAIEPDTATFAARRSTATPVVVLEPR
jgi:F420H(2)-dependent quinone reductase